MIFSLPCLSQFKENDFSACGANKSFASTLREDLKAEICLDGLFFLNEPDVWHLEVLLLHDALSLMKTSLQTVWLSVTFLFNYS